MPLLAEGEFALVRQHLEAAVHMTAFAPSGNGADVNECDLWTMLADAAARQHDALALRLYSLQAEEMATRCDHALYQAIAHRACGVMHRLEGDHVAAEARLHQSLALFHGLDTSWQIGRTRYELGELAIAQAHADEAREHFSLALAAFERMRAAPDAARTRAALARASQAP